MNAIGKRLTGNRLPTARKDRLGQAASLQEASFPGDLRMLQGRAYMARRDSFGVSVKSAARNFSTLLP